jgi:hypothetical protein
MSTIEECAGPAAHHGMARFKCTLGHNETSLVVLASLVDIFPH